MRVRTGITRHRRHKKVLARTRGFRMTKHRLYKVAKEADLHAGQYAYVGRRLRKRDFRKLWIMRINAGLKEYADGLRYSTLMNLLKNAKIELNRKMLSELTVSDPDAFKAVVAAAKASGS